MTEKRPLIRLYFVHPTDARGWIALGCYTFVWAVLAMIAIDKSLLDNNAFLVIASALVLTGWNQGPVGWAYQATKGGGEMADSSARIAELAASRLNRQPAGTQADPLAVQGAPSGTPPVNTQNDDEEQR